jgi:hypothetical protein
LSVNTNRESAVFARLWPDRHLNNNSYHAFTLKKPWTEEHLFIQEIILSLISISFPWII